MIQPLIWPRDQYLLGVRCPSFGLYGKVLKPETSLSGLFGSDLLGHSR
jgi:hypothetical protein